MTELQNPTHHRSWAHLSHHFSHPHMSWHATNSTSSFSNPEFLSDSNIRKNESEETTETQDTPLEECMESQLTNCILANAKKNVQKSRNTLTKEDRELLLLNSDEYYFTEGAKVFEDDGKIDNTVYWVQSGHLQITDEFGLIAVIGPGTIISTRKISFSGIAQGVVVMRKLDCQYISRLLENDSLLAIRFYKRLATSITTVLRSVISEMEKSDSKTVVAPPELGKKKISLFHGHTSKFRRQNLVHSLSTGQSFNAFVGNHTLTVILKNTKIKIVSNTLGIKSKKRFDYSDIANICKSSNNSITLVLKQKKGKTFFLKTSAETDHLYELLDNILSRFSTPSSKNHTNLPLSQSGHILSQNLENYEAQGDLSSSSNSNGGNDTMSEHSGPNDPCNMEDEKGLGELLFGLRSDDIMHSQQDQNLLINIAETLTFKKGERVISEGDLYQRLYQIVKGEATISSTAGGGNVHTMTEGDVFGEIQLVQLRPCNINITALSETLEVRMITGMKIFYLIDKNPSFGARIYRQIARVIEGKFARFLQVRRFIKENPGKNATDFQLESQETD